MRLLVVLLISDAAISPDNIEASCRSHFFLLVFLRLVPNNWAGRRDAVMFSCTCLLIEDRSREEPGYYEIGATGTPTGFA